MTTNLGASGYFPAENATINEYYSYTATTAAATKGLFDLSFAGEVEIQNGLLMQLGVGYTQSNSFTAQGNFIQGVDAQSQNSYTYKYKILPKQLLAQAKLLVLGNSEQKFHPYIIGGVGAAQNHVYNYSTDVPYTLTFTRSYESTTQTSMSFIIGGGVEFDIHEQVRLGFGYRYTGLGKATLGDATIDGVPVSGTLTQSNLNANQILSQLTFIF